MLDPMFVQNLSRLLSVAIGVIMENTPPLALRDDMTTSTDPDALHRAGSDVMRLAAAISIVQRREGSSGRDQA